MVIHCLAPSPPEGPTHIPSTSRTPSRLIPIATYTGRFATLPERTLSTIASIKITGYTASNGRAAHFRMSLSTWSVTRETRSREIEVSYTCSQWATMSLVVIPLAYNEMTASSNPASRRRCLGTITGANVPSRSRGTSTVTFPISVVTVFGVDPLRELPRFRPAGSPLSYPRWAAISASNAD